MSRFPQTKIFVSHHNSDAPKLAALKTYLSLNGFHCFLAPEDIRPGKYASKEMMQELENCDVLLYISSENALSSDYCQQEIGYALGQKKEIISAMREGFPPKGFIAEIQAIRFTDIGEDFCLDVYNFLLEKYSLPNRVKKHLQILKIEGFSQLSVKNKIRILPNNKWNDHCYETVFNLFIEDQAIGEVKICHLSQAIQEHTSKKLPREFAFLDQPFFSRVHDRNIKSDVLNPEKIKSLQYLLNDIRVISKDQKNIISKENVYKKSLQR